jgi:iron(III) transport system permease protein
MSPKPIVAQEAITYLDIGGIRKEHLLQYGIAGVTALLILAPLLPILYQSLLDRPLYDAGGIVSLANYVKLFTDPSFHKVILNSVVFAILTTLFSVIGGTVMAILIGRTDVPARHLFSGMILWPLYLSPLVVAFGWILMYGPAGYITLWLTRLFGFAPWNLYTIPGMALVAGISQLPLAYLYCSSSTNVADPSLEDAARTVGAGPFRTLCAVTLPLMRPPVLYSAVLIFTTSLELLSIPLILGGPVGIDFFASYLYNQGITAPKPDYGLVGAASVLLLVIVTVLVIIQSRLLRNAGRFVTVGGKATRPRLLRLGMLRWLFSAGIGLYVVVGALIPIGGLVLRAFTAFLTPLIPLWQLFTWDNVVLIFSYPAYVRSILNSIQIALIGGVLATLFIALITLVTHRSAFRYRKALEFLALYPRAVPGIIVGIGFFWAMVLVQPLGLLRNTIWGLILAFSMRYIPTGFGAIAPMLMRLGPELDKAARTVGADWWITCRTILLKLLKPALYASFVLLFIQFLKEYSAAVFLFAPGSEVMGITMLQFWIQGDTGPVAALSIMQIVLTVFFASISRRVLGVRVYA